MPLSDVRLQVFEGPVELLLYLVRKNELDVQDVPVARLTDDFLGHIRQAERLNIEAASDFLVMAAVLLRLKVRRIIPVRKDEELDTPTVTLEQILDEFRRYQQAARVLQDREQQRRLVFPHPPVLPRGQLAEQADVVLLTEAFRRVMAKLSAERIVEVAPRKIRLEDKLDQLRRLVRSRGRVTFEEAVDCRTLTELIVMFVAVLELTRLGEIRVRQDEQFGTILLELKTATPLAALPADPPTAAANQ